MHHSFDIGLAEIYGIEGAILLHHFQQLIEQNQRLKKNFHEGAYWTCQTAEETAAYFPYLSVDKVRNTIEYLCTGISRRSRKQVPDFVPVLVKGNFNESKFDRTAWYALYEDIPTNKEKS